ncbi:MAG: hypothetical protein Kow0065_05000 [Methylomicrobium sp.]
MYHSGTACSSRQWGENHSLLPFIDRCRHHEIPIYLAPSIKSDNAYQSTRELLDRGASTLWNLTLECAYVKLLLAYGNFVGEDIERFIEHDIAAEHV